MKRRRRNSAKTTVQAYSADRPIVSKRQDILGRAKFAARLADDLHNWSGDDSLVVALYGTWGSGKTSVKNLLLEANRKRRRLPLKIVDFNPWQLSGTGGIPASFFRELGLALGDQGPKRDVEKRAKRLKTYAGTLSVMGTTTDLVGTALQLAGVPGSTMLKNIGRGMKSAGTTAKAGSETLSAMHDAESKSLEAQKSELAELLARLPQPLLVVIDDIDRLTTSEILQVFQLVKANADFPCLIYLLLFEREVVGKALDEVSGGKGTEFLEKIVQVGYHVPQVSR
ncbi:MAG TPA: P-loop NTPase fold protein, partial [Verrucomicrobiae bacterium]|nr:P-loop NTPase fold protein [Verrucomicrobiae bacterium]